ncbi:hypothetical protein D187_006912 [Cystobacter fuscus DSM 2262]|uniref:Uncharacterized protein n=1 Tax=Cystobacter fuscus (strain ATCC 25194 / DSM 2262 / NBRC 100088 / M29) TaxID=1242864 RepID=S9QL21_CYSF2|nr:hypothetical protein D187_006912 [Cystobacter fuscus DSM 2262]
MCLAAAGVLAMLAASRAHAGWREVTSMPERPNATLDVWGNGTFSLGFMGDGRGGAYLFVDGGVARRFNAFEASASVGTSYQPDTDCFVSVDQYGQRTSLGADGGLCGGINPSTPSINNHSDEGLQRVKHAVGGGAAAATYGNNQHTLLLSDAGLATPANTFSPVLALEQGSTRGAPLAVMRVGDSVYSVIGVLGSTTEGRWETIPFKDSGRWVLGALDAGPVQAVELFPVEGASVPFAMVGTRHAFIQGSLDNETPRLDAVQRLAAGEELVALSMNVREGGDGGHGFGMALVARADGGLQVMSPVPMQTKALAGTVWRPRVIPPDVMKNMTAKLKQVACHGASFCVLSAPGETVHNVFSYSNDASPEISVWDADGEVVTAMEFERGKNYKLTFLGKDPDGDPVRLTTSYSVTGSWEVKPVSAEPGEPVVMEISTSPICQTTEAGHFELTASDGLAAHEVRRTMPVRVVWTPLKPDSLQVSLSQSAQTLRVDSPLECEVERGLRADLRLEPEDANVPTRTARVDVPGEWSLTDLDCGRYHLRATLEDATGSSVEQQERSMVLPGRGVSLEPRPQNGMKAVCGQGATVSLSTLVTPTPGFCQTPDYSWTYESALEFEQLSEPDGTVRLASKAKELDALLGGSVRVGVTASKGPARTELSFDVPISVDPFVKVGRRSELPVASETGLVGVLVDLTNTTACDVSGARYVEHLEGLAYVEGSATLDGVPVETHWNGDALQVDGLLLAGGATRTLSYVARPLLVGERRMWGEASKGDVRLSVSEGNEPRPSGCGCASAESGPMLFVLAAMGAALRRRSTARS